MKRNIIIGMDLGDKNHIAVVTDDQGIEMCCCRVINTKKAIIKFFKNYTDVTVAIEAGTHSAWISRLLKNMGCQVYVGNPRKLRLIWDSSDKTDERDARMLAMVCRLEPKFLWPIKHRNAEAHSDLEVIKARDMLVQTRTKLVNHVRSAVKGTGERLPSCSAASFSKKVVALLPAELKSALNPLIEIIVDLTAKIGEFDKQIAQLAQDKYPETQQLQQVQGVGPITALCYVLTIEDPGRFEKSRSVGKHVGLTPRLDKSGQTDKQLRITKEGNQYLRTLLVRSAHYIIGPFGPDTALSRHGLRIAARGGKNAKKRAAVAVARKLAVLLHRLWVSGAAYQPFYGMAKIKKAA